MLAGVPALPPTMISRSVGAKPRPSQNSTIGLGASVGVCAQRTHAETERAAPPVGSCGSGADVRKEPGATRSAPAVRFRWSLEKLRPAGCVAAKAPTPSEAVPEKSSAVSTGPAVALSWEAGSSAQPATDEMKTSSLLHCTQAEPPKLKLLPSVVVEQRVQEAGEDAPTTDDDVPGAHSVQAAEPGAKENVPAAQGRQLDVLADE